MRRLFAWFPQPPTQDTIEALREEGAVAVVHVDARGDDGAPRTLLLLEAPNRDVEGVVDVLSTVEGAHISLLPSGVLAMSPPAGQPPEHLTDVTLRSPIEIFLGGLQSVGSWWGFLGYAAIAGGVAWLGLYTNTVYLLTAAMLIAPFAGPAMNAALATSRGDGRLLGRSALRYVTSLLVAAAAATALSVVFGLDTATEEMTATASLTFGAVVLPLLAGAAGAVNLVQSDRSSLVSGAATGMLVAAALAPPAAALGVAVAVQSGPLTEASLFQLGLQLVGINVAGAAVFGVAGLRPGGARYPAGATRVRAIALCASAVAVLGFAWWQVADQPDLTRTTISRRAVGVVQDELRATTGVELVEATAHFGPGDALAANRLIVLASVAGDAALEPELEDRLLLALGDELTGVTPLVDLTFLRAPDAGR